MWQAGQESNLQPADLEAAALPIELPAFTPEIIPHPAALCNPAGPPRGGAIIVKEQV